VRAIVSSIFALALFGCGSETASGPPPSAASALAGKILPDFKRPALDGEKIDTQKLRGRVLVVKFFAEYCAPCKQTLPAAEALHRERPEIAFVGVSEDEDRGQAEALARRFALSFPVIHDQGQVLSGRFRVTEMPATFVVGPDGTVRWVGGASQSKDALRQAVDAVR
jgi:peroxiredoxin